MNEVNFSNYDRIMLEKIKYHLEAIVRYFEKQAAPPPEWYEFESGIFDLNKVVSFTKSRAYSHLENVFYLNFYLGGTDQGEITYQKKFEFEENRDREYEQLKEKLMKK